MPKPQVNRGELLSPVFVFMYPWGLFEVYLRPHIEVRICRTLKLGFVEAQDLPRVSRG